MRKQVSPVDVAVKVRVMRSRLAEKSGTRTLEVICGPSAAAAERKRRSGRSSIAAGGSSPSVKATRRRE